MGKRKRTTSSKDTNEGPVKQSYNEDAGSLDARKGRVLPPGKSSMEVSAEAGDLPLSSRIATQRPEDQELVTQQLQVHGNMASPTRTAPAPAASGAPPLASSVVTVRSQQLRTSARVQSKQQQRREEENRHDAPTAGVQQPTKGQLGTEGAEESGGGGGGGSGGGNTTTSGPGGGGEQLRRKRRPWELWSLEDKNLFFEALNECGKDFEGLQTYLATKLRKKGVPGYQIKNRDKVRHFYYRTWHKIAKYMKFYEDDRIFSGVKKATQELYGLINYGELRKKVGGTLDERKGQKLQELVLKGSTSVRIRGKSVRVKTPICRALKRVNQLEDNKDGGEVPRLPPCVQVELVPASGRAWRRVQELAFNPRVRLTCALHRTLASLVRHLQDKWRPPQLKLRDKLVSGANFAVTVPDVKEPRVRVRPPKDCVIARISVQPGELIRSSSVSLASHEARLVAASSSLRGVAAAGSHQRGSGSGSTKDKGSTAATTAGKRKKAIKVVADANNRTETDYSSDDERPVILGGGPDLSAEGSGEVRSVRAGQVMVKDEPLDPPDSPLPSEQQVDQKLFHPDLQIKEEEEEGDISSRAVRELLALRTVARGPEEDQRNADVVCVGETTRLAALRLEGSATSSAVTTKLAPTLADRGEASVMTPVSMADSEEEEREVTREQDVGTEVPGGVDQGSGTELAAEREAQQKAQEEEGEMDRIRSGWTISSGIGITFGELYLRIGRNEKLCLEYEFEEAEDQDQEDEPVSSCVSPTTTATSTAANTSPTGPTSPSMGIFQTPPKPSRVTDHQGVESEMRQGHVRTGLDAVDTKGLIKGKEAEATESKEERRAAIENVSGMLCQLLVMARSLTTRPSCDKCPCGHVCGVRGGNLRSPATNRQLGAGGLGGVGAGRSPGGGRTIVGAAVGAGGTRGSPSTARGSPSTTRVSKDRAKPNSAKQLLVGEGAAMSLGGKGVVNGGAPPTAGSAGSTTAKELFAAVPPSSPVTHHPVVATSMPSSVGGVSVVVGASGGGSSATDPSGEFRVPLAPAPRQHTGTQSQQHQSFSAQLNKLLPRFNNRVGRRSVRKNVVVRQLPLLPKQSLPSSVVALKVVPQNRLTQGLTLNGGSANQVQMALPPNTATILPQQQPPTQQPPLPGGMMAKVTLPSLKENPPPGTNTVSVNIPNQPPLRVEISSANTFAVSPSPPAAVPTLVTPTSSIASSSVAASVAGIVTKVEPGTWNPVNQTAPPTGKLVAAGTVPAVPGVELGVWAAASNQTPPPAGKLMAAAAGTVPTIPKIELGTWTASNQVSAPSGKLVVAAGAMSAEPKMELGRWHPSNQISSAAGKPVVAGTLPQENTCRNGSVSRTCATVVPNVSCKLEPPTVSQDGSNSNDILHTLASQVFTDLPELRLVTSEFETSTARQTVSHKPQLAPAAASVISTGGAAAVGSPQTVEDSLPSLSSLLRSPSECGLTAATEMCLNTDGLLQTASSLELPQHKDVLQNQSTNLTLASHGTLLASTPTLAFDGGGGGRRREGGGGEAGGQVTQRHLPCTSTAPLPPVSASMNTTTSPTTPLMSLLLQSTEVAASSTTVGPTSSSPPQLATVVSSASSVSPPGGAIPEFHIPESLMPMLDISLGGTISLADPSPPTPQTPNTPMPIHHNNPVHHQEGSDAPSSSSSSSSCPTTTSTSNSTFSKFTASNTFLMSAPFNATTFSSSFSATTTADSSPTFTTTASGAFSATSFNTNTLHTSFNTTTTASSFSDASFSISSYPSSAVATSMSETSTDKLLDLALTNSNSNSSFTSLLAAAASLQPLHPSPTPQSSAAGPAGGRQPPPQPPPPLPPDDSTLDTPPRPVVAPGGSTSAVVPPPFPALSSTPPPPSSSPPSSPSRLLLLHHTDSQWLNNEVNDFSLSSFLGHLESPLKVLTTPGTGQASSSPVASSSSSSTATTTTAATGSVAGTMLPSLAHLTAVLNENSVDFTAKFAEMKAAASANTAASAAFKP
ncbi:cramped chromatin regulator isoform X2 [Oratosquilla oratoria]|uniref:cramped chromatin regulator isoform X2 n=1 Tax=Oratosquilla oratoria TaxID=337810 RepID=UPI003F7644D2